MIDPDRPVAWAKLTAAEYHLSHTYDYIMYVDMDVVIMDMVSSSSLEFGLLNSFTNYSLRKTNRYFLCLYLYDFHVFVIG